MGCNFQSLFPVEWTQQIYSLITSFSLPINNPLLITFHSFSVLYIFALLISHLQVAMRRRLSLIMIDQEFEVIYLYGIDLWISSFLVFDWCYRFTAQAEIKELILPHFQS